MKQLWILVFSLGSSAFANEMIAREACVPANTAGASSVRQIEHGTLVGSAASRAMDQHHNAVKVKTDRLGRVFGHELSVALDKNITKYEYAPDCFTYQQAMVEMYCSQVAGQASTAQCELFCIQGSWSDDCR